MTLVDAAAGDRRRDRDRPRTTRRDLALFAGREDALRRAGEPEPRRGRGRRVADSGAADLRRARAGRPGDALGGRAPGRLDAERARAFARREDALRRERRRRRGGGRGRRGRSRTARAQGFIPSGWYPAALALSRDGKTLWVANAKGGGLVGERRRAGPTPTEGEAATRPAKTRTIPGSRLARLRFPSAKELAALTVRAYANRKPAARGASPARASAVVPATPGGPSPIKHVVYVDPREPHVRPGPRRPSAGQRRPVAHDLRARRDAERARARRGVRPPRQLLLRRRGLGRRPQLVDGGVRDGLRGEGLAADLRQRTASPTSSRETTRGRVPTNGYLWDAAARAGALAAQLRGVHRHRRRVRRADEAPASRGEGGRAERRTPARSTPASTWTSSTTRASTSG